MSKKLEDLLPEVKDKVEKALKELKNKNIQVVVTYTFRTKEEQYALWCQGRKTLEETNKARAIAGLAPIKEYLGKDKKIHSDNDYTVTNCNGTKVSEGGTGRSPHQTGKAIDIVPDMDLSEKQVPGWPAPSDPRWLQIATVMEAHGFEWGGRWTDFPDYPHYQVS